MYLVSFSNIWLDMTDDIYFDESLHVLDRVRIIKEEFFKDKIVLDGLGVATIARG